MAVYSAANRNAVRRRLSSRILSRGIARCGNFILSCARSMVTASSDWQPAKYLAKYRRRTKLRITTNRVRERDDDWPYMKLGCGAQVSAVAVNNLDTLLM